MADDNTINIQFTSDTSGFRSGAEQVQSEINNINNAIEATKISSMDAIAPASQLFSSMAQSAASALNGIMTGTETWHQAMLKTISDLEVKFVDAQLSDVLNWTKNQAAILASTISTNAALVTANDAKNASITSGDSAAASSSLASHAGQVIKQIESDAAATYAGVYAYMSPVLGPAAAVPAGVAFAAVAAMEGLVSLDVGAWNLGSDMVAQLHQGEMVVPQNFAQGLREGGGLGGGDNYTINVNAIDTQTGTQFLKNNAASIASILSSQVRNFNSSVPAWKG